MRARRWENSARLPRFSMPSARGKVGVGIWSWQTLGGMQVRGPPDFKLPEQDYSPWRLLFDHLMKLIEVSF